MTCVRSAEIQAGRPFVDDRSVVGIYLLIINNILCREHVLEGQETDRTNDFQYIGILR